MIKTTTNNVYCSTKCRSGRDNRVTFLGIKGAREALIQRADDRYKGLLALKIKNRKKPIGSICNCAWCNTEYVKQSIRQLYCVRMCGVESGKCKATYLKRNSTNKDKKQNEFR